MILILGLDHGGSLSTHPLHQIVDTEALRQGLGEVRQISLESTILPTGQTSSGSSVTLPMNMVLAMSMAIIVPVRPHPALQGV